MGVSFHSGGVTSPSGVPSANGFFHDGDLNGLKKFRMMTKHGDDSVTAPAVNVGSNTITYLWITNGKANAEGQIYIDVNGVQVAAIPFDTSGDGLNNTTDYITGLSISLSDGDKISVRGDKTTGAKAKDPIVNFG